eukprot:NODE_916_length_3070_cov_0.805453.p2 type:complete len:274 gc:universal NODE_916_length_3070_cov_0.805453:817-1638(+)
MRHSFKANPQKYQVVASEKVEIVIQNQTLQQCNFMRYLGVHINKDGIDYEQEIKHKQNKIKMVQAKLNNGCAKKLFQGKSLFVKDIIDTILSYGLSLWTPKELDKLEKLRKYTINKLFGNTRLIHKYLCGFLNAIELYQRARISHENQIKNIIFTLEQQDTPQNYLELLKRDTSMACNINDYIPLDTGTSNELMERNEERLKEMWNTNPAERGSRLDTESNLMKLLKSNKYTRVYTHHVLRLGLLFMGIIPYKTYKTRSLRFAISKRNTRKHQ